MTATPLPDGLDTRHARRGRMAPHASPFSILLLGGILLAALLGLFGGGTSETRNVQTSEATLSVHTPTTLRSGLFFETRIDVTAKRDIAAATIAIPPSLWKDMTINTVEPAPAEESYAAGALRFDFGPLAAGEALHVKIDGQINPPLFAGTAGEIALNDGDARIASIPLKIRVLP